MCVLLLLLLAGAAASAHPQRQPYGRTDPLEYQASPDYELQPLLPLPLSRETYSELPVKTNRPSHRSDGFAKRIEGGDKDVPRLRTNVYSSQGIEERNRSVKVSKIDRDATHAALQEPAKRRNHEATAGHTGPNETQLASKFNPSDNGDEQESTWVWGTSDASESTNTTAIDDLDDRTSIAGANCPTGQVKIDGKCVEKH